MWKLVEFGLRLDLERHLSSEMSIFNLMLESAITEREAKAKDEEKIRNEEEYERTACDECHHSKITHGIPDGCLIPGKHMHDHDCNAVNDTCLGCITCDTEHLDILWSETIKVCENCKQEFEDSFDIEECEYCESPDLEIHELCPCEYWKSH